MRAMGPGSVSSLLKIGLDVFWYAMIVVTPLLAAGALLTLAIPSIGEAVSASLPAPVSGAKVAGALALYAAYAGVFLMIVRGLRRIFMTLVAGDPFRPENVRRLQGVGLWLAGLAALNLVGRVLMGWWMADVVRSQPSLPDFTAWFAVLVVFVLAEVFREGARLRREAELTI